jgi:hypothetical protein
MLRPRLSRALASALLAAGLLAAGPSGALAQGYTVTGTIVSVDQGKHTIVLETSDVGGRVQPITIDVSLLSDDAQAMPVGSSVSLEIEARESDTYLAVRSGSDDNFAERDTQGGSIKAHVGNGPDDDEAFTQQHRDENLRRQQDDNPSNGDSNDGN